MEAKVEAVPPPGAECVVLGAVMGSQGRKAQVRSALYDSAGALLAQAHSTWIAVSEDSPGVPASGGGGD
jgi:hypothetical protein